jgi:hypothetical protein
MDRESDRMIHFRQWSATGIAIMFVVELILLGCSVPYGVLLARSIPTPKESYTDLNNSVNQIEYWNSVDISKNNLVFTFPELSQYGIFQQHAIEMPLAPVPTGNAVAITLANGSSAQEVESTVSFIVIYDFYTVLSTVQLGETANKNTYTYLVICEDYLGLGDTYGQSYDDYWTTMTGFCNQTGQNANPYWNGYNSVVDGPLTYFVNCTDISPTTLNYGDTSLGVKNVGFIGSIQSVNLLGSTVYENIGTGTNNVAPLDSSTSASANDPLSTSSSVNTTNFQVPTVYTAGSFGTLGSGSNAQSDIAQDGFQNVPTSPAYTNEGCTPTEYVSAWSQGIGYTPGYYSETQLPSFDGSAGYEVQPSVGSTTITQRNSDGSVDGAFDMALAPAINVSETSFTIGTQYIELDDYGYIYGGLFPSTTSIAPVPITKYNGFVIDDRDLRMVFNVTANIYAITQLNAITSNDTYAIPDPLNGNTNFNTQMYQEAGNYTVPGFPSFGLSLPDLKLIMDDIIAIALVIGAVILTVVILKAVIQRKATSVTIQEKAPVEALRFGGWKR